MAMCIGGTVKNVVIERSLLCLRNCAKSNFGIHYQETESVIAELEIYIWKCFPLSVNSKIHT